MNRDVRLVYSSDPKLNQKCPKCKELECICEPEMELKEYKFIAVLRLEKSGRKGKSVIIIDRLPKQKKFLEELTSELKKKCGSGGTYKMDGADGVIEIQGEKKDLIKSILHKKGIQSKG